MQEEPPEQEEQEVQFLLLPMMILELLYPSNYEFSCFFNWGRTLQITLTRTSRSPYLLYYD